MNGTLNKVILIGNVGRDVEVRHFDNNNMIARFPLATSEVYKNQAGEKIEKTEWHNIVARNQLAEIFQKYLRKGDKIYIEGKIKTREYTDKDGIKKYFTEIHVQQFTFLSPKVADATPVNPEGAVAVDELQKPAFDSSQPTDTKSDFSKSNKELDDDLPF